MFSTITHRYQRGALKSFIIDCKNHFTEKEIEFGKHPVAYQDLYLSLDQQAANERTAELLLAGKEECQENPGRDACLIEIKGSSLFQVGSPIKALREALDALGKTEGPGVAEALDSISKGETAAAEVIFKQLKDRKSKEGKTALQEASIAACHLEPWHSCMIPIQL